MIEPQGLRIALTGRRNVGKSTAVRQLERQGFVQVHAFTGGKVAAKAYMSHILAETKYAWVVDEMVFGHLKDVPCPALPGGVAPREFLERFGRFMGVDMGVPWTLQAEVERAERIYGKDVNIAVDSMIYESGYWHDIGGVIVRMLRKDFAGQPVVASDADQAAVKHDHEIYSSSPEEVEENIDYFLKSHLTARQKKN